MVDYNPFSDAVVCHGDPLPIYKRLRDEAPAYYLAEFDSWALSRFEDIWKASADMKNLTAANGTTSAHLLTKRRARDAHDQQHGCPGSHAPARRVPQGLLRAQGRPARADDPPHREGAPRRLSRQRSDGRDPRLLGPRRRHGRLRRSAACAEDGAFLNTLVWRFFQREEGVRGTDRGRTGRPDRDVRLLPRADRAAKAPGAQGRRPAEAARVQAGRKAPDDALASHLSMLIIGGSETFEDARHDRTPARPAPDQPAAVRRRSRADSRRLQRGTPLRHADPSS